MELLDAYRRRRQVLHEVATVSSAEADTPRPAGGYYYRGHWVPPAPKVTDNSRLLLRVLANLPIGVMVADPDSLRIRYVNDTGRDLLDELRMPLGLGDSDVTELEITVLHGEQAPQIARTLREADRLPLTQRFPVGPHWVEITYSELAEAAASASDAGLAGILAHWRFVTDEVRDADAFESGVLRAVGDVHTASGEIQATAQELSDHMGSLTDAVSGMTMLGEAASRNIEQAEGAATDLSRATDRISAKVGESESAANDAAERVAHANERVESLNASMAQIGDILRLINDIAEQTNLLALNATIEAARAGEAGRGFAVVANEVKSLAGQTQRATDQIRERIATAQSETRDAVTAIAGIGGTVHGLTEATHEIAEAVNDQGRASAAILNAVDKASNTTKELTGTVSGTAATVGEVVSAASDGVALLESRVAHLSDTATQLQEQAQAFLQRLH